MNTATAQDYDVLYREMVELRERLIKAHQSRPVEPIEKVYTFRGADGSQVTLDGLFAGHRNLITIHNMGRGCAYCTMWADGFIGLYRHLKQRTGFVLVSPDPWETVRDVAKERGWPFPCVSMNAENDTNNGFSADMGFHDPDANTWLPGASAFTRRDDGTVARVSTISFGPGDLFCPAWHFFDMLPGEPKGFSPS
jgi:predicted dithiol-disulfide oxidoreductase (DUF899 family)